jgi:two-component system response regulator AtoC
MSLEKILVLDDEMIIRKTLEDHLRKKRFSVKSVGTLEEARKVVYNDSFDVFFIDLKLPDGEGIDLLKELKDLPNPPLPIMLSGHGSMETVIECMRLGARDYVSKPFDSDQIELALKTADDWLQMVKVTRYYNEQQSAGTQLVGECPAMSQLMRIIRRVAMTKATILITGENGTGKELVASELHRNSELASQPYIRVNCAAIPADLVESEFFGHEKGAFTGAVNKKLGRFEIADNGTILLDEIGEIPLSLQTKLLRVLQEQEFQRVGGTTDIKVDVRVIASTNKDLLKEVEKGNFREDLFYRLNVFPIEVPPLRDRGEDILLLAKTFLEKHSRSLGRDVPGFSKEAEQALMAHRWPGNVRELNHAVERAAILAMDGVPIPPENLLLNGMKAGAIPMSFPPARVGQPDDGIPSSASLGDPEPLDSQPQPAGKAVTNAIPERGKALADLEREQILLTLEHTNGNRTEAAKILGISDRTLRNKIKEYQQAGFSVPPPAG